MKAALIGTGRWGKVLQGELEKQVDVKYACDSSSDLNQVWNDPEVQAVFIATPTNTHFDIAKLALESGKNVFLEKPGTTSSTDLEKLVTLAEEKKLTFAVGYEFPHHPAAQKLKGLLLGKEIRTMRFEWLKWGTFKDDAIHHLLCHEVSIMKFLRVTDLTPLSCQKTRVISDTDIVETEFANITSLINRASPIKQKTVTVITEDGGYVWSNNELFEIVGEELKKIEIPPTTPVAAEIADFLHSETPLANGRFALEVWSVLEELRIQ